MQSGREALRIDRLIAWQAQAARWRGRERTAIGISKVPTHDGEACITLPVGIFMLSVNRCLLRSWGTHHRCMGSFVRLRLALIVLRSHRRSAHIE